jgi:hypothetical protein
MMNDDVSNLVQGNNAGQSDVDLLEKQLVRLRSQADKEHKKIVEERKQAAAKQRAGKVASLGGKVFSDDASDVSRSDDRSQMGTGGFGDKEREPVVVGGDNVPLVQYQEQEKVPEKVESWVERINSAEDISLPEPVMDDDDNVVMAEEPVKVINDAVIVPLTEDELKQGLKHKVVDSVRWLAEWVMKVIKMNGDKAFFKQENE